MSFTQFFRILWARRGFLVLSLLVCVISGLLIAKLLPKRYEASSRVMLDIVKPDPVTGEVIASQFARAYTRTQIELIRDYRVAGKVADTFGWTKSPTFTARYEADGRSDKPPFRRWLAEQVIKDTEARLIEGSNILEITYSSSSPDSAARIADALRQAYIDQTLVFRRETASRNAAWFRTQSEKLRTELTAAEKRKTDFERENGIILQDDKTDTETARLAAIAATAPQPSMPIAAAPVVTAGPSAGQLAGIDAAIANASKTLGPNHPDLQNLRAQRSAIAAAAGREAAAARGSRPIMSSGPSIGAIYSAQQAKVLAQRGKVAEAQRLAADVTLLRENLNKTATRATELQQQAESNESGLTLLGNAVSPQSPAFPNVPLILIASLVAGLGIGVLAAIIAELFKRRVRSVDDMAFEGVPVIGAMARDQEADRPQTVSAWLGLDKLRLRNA
jgi:polysaccharide biosynthesis transport protein